jgi:hypothetical protein
MYQTYIQYFTFYFVLNSLTILQYLTLYLTVMGLIPLFYTLNKVFRYSYKFYTVSGSKIT